jgi:CRP-like cAMP-binding protein
VTTIYGLEEGELRVTRRGRDLGTVAPGTAVGALALFARDPDGFGAVAESDVLALEIDADALLELFEDRFAMVHHILRQFCRQIIEAQRQPGARWGLPYGPTRGMRVPARELDLVERIFFLRQAAPFRRSSINALFELSRGLTEVRFDPGTTLWQEGEPSAYVLMLVSGTVSGTISSSGLQFQSGAGAPLGALESLGEVPRWYGLVTESRVVALHGNIEGLIDVFEDNFDMVMDYMAVVARTILHTIGSPSA